MGREAPKARGEKPGRGRGSRGGRAGQSKQGAGGGRRRAESQEPAKPPQERGGGRSEVRPGTQQPAGAQKAEASNQDAAAGVPGAAEAEASEVGEGTKEAGGRGAG